MKTDQSIMLISNGSKRSDRMNRFCFENREYLSGQRSAWSADPDRLKRIKPLGPFSGRTAFTLIETGIALFLLTACLAALAQLHTILISQQNRIDTAETARLQLQNILEIISNTPADSIASGNFSKEKYQNIVANTLPDGEIRFETVPLVFKNENKIADPADDDQKSDVKKTGSETSAKPSEKSETITAHLFQVTVSWSDGIGRPRRSLSLTRLLP